MNPPQNTHHQRRRLRRQSREVDTKLPIETYLYRCDPYRSSTIQSPWPCGVRVLEHPAIRSLILTYKNDIRDTFIKHGFPADGSGVRLSFAVRRVFPPNQPATTILGIGIENDPVSNRDLSEVRDAVHGLLSSRGLKTVHVDIYDNDRRFSPKKFPIPLDHPAALKYGEIKGAILRLLRKKTDLPWQSVGLYRVGRNLEQAKPCIIISVSPGAMYNWASLRRQMLRLQGPADIDVEILPEVMVQRKPAESGVQ